MSEKKNTRFPRFEIVIILVFFFSFIVWAMSKCSDIRDAAAQKLAEEVKTEQQVDLPDLSSVAARDSTIKDTVYITKVDTTRLTRTNVYGRLYITINNLKIRKEPGLKSDVLGQLPLFQEVTFLDEVTDSTYQINLGYETATEPYVKIRTQKGTEGWVYGAGVNYYKKKRSGVLE